MSDMELTVRLITVLVALGCVLGPVLRSVYRREKRPKKRLNAPVYESYEEMKAKKIAKAMEED